MRKLLYVFIFSLAMIACTGNQNIRTVNSDSTLVDTIEVVDSNLIDTITIDSICND